MIRFVDVNTGNVYDGSKPYIHCFEGKQSVGLNYDKQFIVISDNDKLYVNLFSEVFFLVKDVDMSTDMSTNTSLGTVEFYEKKYINLEDIKTSSRILLPSITLNSAGNKATSTDSPFLYLYTFNVIACGKYVGEITDTLEINRQEFSICADFVDENEALNVNLKNFGVDISNEVQRSIYEKRIDEQKTDYVLLNRKFKELLNEYINIIANKGSYKSLINSLNWFEYGDLVQIYEYWKHPEPNRDYLSRRDITQIITEKTQDLLNSVQKTTYIGISAALKKFKITNGIIEFDYDKNTGSTGTQKYVLVEPNPSLDEVSMIWTKNEMQLKMVLLGNFFATYFMPIHLDLIHSTIEDIVYSQTIKVHANPFFERFDDCNHMRAMICDVKKLYHLGNIETFTNLSTPFGFTDINQLNEEDENLKILGVDLYENTNDFATEIGTIKKVMHNKAYNLQHFKGIGAVIPFNCTLYNLEVHNSTSFETITEGEIYVYKNEELIAHRITYNIKNHKKRQIVIDKSVLKINFNILVQEIGDYKVQLSFKTSTGALYTKMVEFSVDEEIYQNLEMYRLVKKNNTSSVLGFKKILQWMSESDTNENIIELDKNIADYVLSPIQYHKYIKDYLPEQPNEYVEDPTNIYMQFIASNASINKKRKSNIQTNQIVIIKLSSWEDDPNKSPNLNILSNLNRIKTNNIQATQSNTPFFWMVLDRYGNLVKEEDITDPDVLIEFSGEKTKYVIGICKYFEKRYNVVLERKTKADKIWKRDMFVPFFYKLEKMGQANAIDRMKEKMSEEDIFRLRVGKDTYIISQDEVVCFLPDIKCIKRPNNFMWKYVCETNNKEITPITYRTKDGKDWEDRDKTFPSILQPLFGRYDFRILPDPGYYTVTCNYKMDDDQKQNSTRSISSEFIVVKPEDYFDSIEEDE